MTEAVKEITLDSKVLAFKFSSCFIRGPKDNRLLNCGNLVPPVSLKYTLSLGVLQIHTDLQSA